VSVDFPDGFVLPQFRNDPDSYKIRCGGVKYRVHQTKDGRRWAIEFQRRRHLPVKLICDVDGVRQIKVDGLTWENHGAYGLGWRLENRTWAPSDLSAGLPLEVAAFANSVLQQLAQPLRQIRQEQEAAAERFSREAEADAKRNTAKAKAHYEAVLAQIG
jgi:hypothetical protein